MQHNPQLVNMVKDGKFREYKRIKFEYSFRYEPVWRLSDNLACIETKFNEIQGVEVKNLLHFLTPSRSCCVNTSQCANCTSKHKNLARTIISDTEKNSPLVRSQFSDIHYICHPPYAERVGICSPASPSERLQHKNSSPAATQVPHCPR